MWFEPYDVSAPTPPWHRLSSGGGRENRAEPERRWGMTNDEIPGYAMTNDEIPKHERMTNVE